MLNKENKKQLSIILNKLYLLEDITDYKNKNISKCINVLQKELYRKDWLGLKRGIK